MAEPAKPLTIEKQVVFRMKAPVEEHGPLDSGYIGLIGQLEAVAGSKPTLRITHFEHFEPGADAPKLIPYFPSRIPNVDIDANGSPVPASLVKRAEFNGAVAEAVKQDNYLARQETAASNRGSPLGGDMIQSPHESGHIPPPRTPPNVKQFEKGPLPPF